MQGATRLPGGYSLPTWQQHARRDDCLEHMVPSDLRQFLGLIERQQQVIDLLMKAVEPFETYLKEKGRQEWMYDVDDIAPALESEFGENVRLTMGDLRRAREAKVEAERILSPREKTND